MANARSMGLWLALAGALAATWYAAGMGDQADGGDLLAEPVARDAPRPRAATPSPVAPPTAEVAPPDGEPRMDPEGIGNLFAARSWLPPPPPPPTVVAPAPRPVAPPLPYRYVGRMEEDGAIVVFLAEGAETRHRLVRQGDQWPDYRVDEINAQGMRLTYLPLNQTQRLLFGSPN